MTVVYTLATFYAQTALFDGGSGGVIAILAVLGGFSWIGVLLTAFFQRKNNAATTVKVKAEAAEIFTDMAVRTAESNEKLYAKIEKDNDRLRAQLDAARREQEERDREHEEESRRLHSELEATRRELNAVREELSRARDELRSATIQMTRANERMDRQEADRDDEWDGG